jgi:hypothetical protein
MVASYPARRQTPQSVLEVPQRLQLEEEGLVRILEKYNLLGDELQEFLG